MSRGFYNLEETPQYQEQTERLLNDDPVLATGSFFESLIVAILNNIKAVKLEGGEIALVANAAIPGNQKGVAGGVATLGANGKLVQMPTAADVGARPNTWTPTASEVGAVPVTITINGKALTASITLTKADVGLGSVENIAPGAMSVNYANSAGSAPANGGISAACSGNAATATNASNAYSCSGNAATASNAYACNGLTFSVEASPPGAVTNNRITFSYG